jgi:2-keto-4-pentenoate hydratase/2-oxohepta-3-ene-1,7-dioic acid hydratase in catechol pathway
MGLAPEAWRTLVESARLAPAMRLADLELASLASPTATIWALALNYDSHVNEGGHARPDHPMMFLRLPASFAGHEQPLLKPRATAQFDYEGELAEAHRHIGGYACCNEGSVREWQRHTSQITPGKNFWRSGALGPWLQLADGYDPGPRILRTRVNGQEVQRARVDEMLFKIDEVIAYLSQIAPLCVGDVILMGTPGGVGFRRSPQLFLKAGDEVCVEIEGLGRLRNLVRDR